MKTPGITLSSYPVLKLGNGCRCAFSGLDADARRTLARLTTAMQLPLGEPPVDLLIAARAGYERPQLQLRTDPDTEYVEVPILPQEDLPDGAGFPMFQWAAAAALCLRRHRALLVHGALIRRATGGAVVLSGPGGVGKSTASAALQAPWQALADDACLLSYNADGWYAQAWPTFSRFQFGGPGGAWDCAQSFALDRICFLRKSGETKLLPIGNGSASVQLLAVVEDLGRPVLPEQVAATRRRLRLEALDLVSRLARDCPCYELHCRRGQNVGTLLDELPEPSSREHQREPNADA